MPDLAQAIARGAFNRWRASALQGLAAAERPTYDVDVARLAAAVDASFLEPR
ncbi:hypothetical protein [Burkholderia sp. MS455]|uniref:hypothetical protein n=1 Tax=Burkholderia sp. MS455 TaxID=2811788 RepID=UPI001957F1FD|nr:hypothetical protein [Burkholderia sp. MS455]